MPGPCSNPVGGKTATCRRIGKAGLHARNQVLRANFNKALNTMFKQGCNQKVVPLPAVNPTRQPKAKKEGSK